MKTLEALITFWGLHGTKALGSLASFFGAVQTAALAMNAVDPAHPIISVRNQILLAGLSTLFGALTIRRGFTNTASQPQQS